MRAAKFSLSKVQGGRWRYPSVLALAFVIPYAEGRVLVPGETETISPSPVVESWLIAPDATLNVNGADTLNIDVQSGRLNVNTGSTQQIVASAGSTVNLSGATVTGASGSVTVSLVNSNASIKSSTISGLNFGLQAVRNTATSTGSNVSLLDSTVRGELGGALVTSYSTLDLNNSTIEGTGSSSFGLQLAGGQATLNNGSRIIGGLNGVTFGLDRTDEQISRLVLNNSSVEGKTGSAIVANIGPNPLGSLVIEVSNGSTLIGGNGTILEVAGDTNVNFAVDNSVLQGNIVVEAGSNVAASLNNRASLTGDLQNVAQFNLDNQSAFTGTIKGDDGHTTQVVLDNGSTFTGGVEGTTDLGIKGQSTWTMTGSNSINKLSLDGGRVDFAPGPNFYTLNVRELSGNGVFNMRTDFSTGETDFLKAETASGEHVVSVSATGGRPSTAERIQIAQLSAGDASLALRNGAVDVGAFTYKLIQDGDGWFLRPDGEVSSSTRSVMAIANTAPTIIYAESTLLNSRMGDRRLTGAKPGLWTRTYNNRYSVQNAYAGGYSQTQQGLVIGADAALGDSDWLVGGMVGYSRSQLDLKHGSSGSVDSYSVGAYLTRFDPQTGFYVDAVTKLNRFDNKLDVSMSDGVKTKGSYDAYGLSGSVEVGLQDQLGRGFFWGPFAQVAAAVVSGEHYKLDNGLEVDSDLTRSLVVKGGAYIGSEIDLGNGHKLQPRMRVAVGQELIKRNTVGVNDSSFNNDSSATSLELAGGINWALPHGLQVFAEAGSSQSKTVKQDYNVSAGLSFNF
ncbi:autotransporter outer membrane beta-barrel domain-containing protein [Pseudomonas corrugata]|uniref:Autotransporter outer membrane beta-barrel domain-containing protein n=1 Tax=Pseudomonas corrugata TaxID=47879 RepID=A0A7Y5Z3Q6_9PSED|nr:autotransporter outer membrane beta-barrel domain-containing protein [Pseudomonas corrugata]NUT86372.1 autotransporter outer membrane beta-barrel domain-containing protein [Pseudomonas corrugata]